jgi:hypothetical protein
MRILANLESLQSLIHDYWFDLDQVLHDAQQRTVRLGLGGHKRGPYDQRIIMVTHVLRVSVMDEAEIQLYDMNRIEAAGRIRLVSNFPLEIRLAVSSGSELSIEVLRGDCYYLPLMPA